VTFSKPVVLSTVSLTVTDAAGPIAGAVSLDSSHTTATFTPSSPLPAGTPLTVSVSGEQDQFGQTGQSQTFTFITAKATPPAGQCPCSVWPDSTIPANPDDGDSSAVTLGLKFTANANGYVSGVRFFKAVGNIGAHVATLWAADGTVLATGTFTSESTTGWEELDFPTSVPVSAGTTYVASYFAPNGHYAAQDSGLASAVTSGPLTALASGGVYAYGSSPTFPASSYHGTNYWVDVVYSPTPNLVPPDVATALPSSGATSVPVTAPLVVNFTEAIQSGSAIVTVTGPGNATVAGSTTLDSTGTVVTFTPAAALSAGTSYTVQVSGATNTSGTGMTAPVSYQFTTTGTSACPCTLFESDAAPVDSSANDSSAVTLGVQFTPSANGWISGLRFYKGAGNTGTHTGNLWTSGGTLLAQATFTGESGSGWQTVLFMDPVAVTAGTTYVASYYAPNGHYANDGNYFSSAVTNGPLTAPASSAGTANGLYKYGSDQFPTQTYQAANYWVDPIFSATQPPVHCPCSIWAGSAQPAIPSENDHGSIELGVVFQPAVNGTITGIMFYKGTGNTGTHVGSLWTASGTLLGSVTFTGESASGWQEADFATPINVTAGTSYVASYLAPNGGYAETDGAFTSAVTNGPLTAVQYGTSGGNGVYLYTSSVTFPTSAYNSNYWVDVVFTPSS
jgi:hypothetical protein